MADTLNTITNTVAGIFTAKSRNIVLSQPVDVQKTGEDLDTTKMITIRIPKINPTQGNALMATILANNDTEITDLEASGDDWGDGWFLAGNPHYFMDREMAGNIDVTLADEEHAALHFPHEDRSITTAWTAKKRRKFTVSRQQYVNSETAPAALDAAEDGDMDKRLNRYHRYDGRRDVITYRGTGTNQRLANDQEDVPYEKWCQSFNDKAGHITSEVYCVRVDRKSFDTSAEADTYADLSSLHPETDVSMGRTKKDSPTGLWVGYKVRIDNASGSLAQHAPFTDAVFTDDGSPAPP